MKGCGKLGEEANARNQVRKLESRLSNHSRFWCNLGALRFASPDDIARAIAFLADPQESGFINGHALVVDGGWIADESWEALRLRHR